MKFLSWLQNAIIQTLLAVPNTPYLDFVVQTYIGDDGGGVAMYVSAPGERPDIASQMYYDFDNPSTMDWIRANTTAPNGGCPAI